MIAHAQQAHGALGHQRGEGLHGLGQRHRRILDVRVQQVQPGHAEPVPAAFRRLADHPGRQSFGVVGMARTRGQRPGAELGRDHDLVADATAAPPAAEQFLALPALGADPERIAVGGVDKGAPGLHVPVQDRERGRLVGRRAEVHRAQAKHAHLMAGLGVRANRGVFHAGFLSSRPLRPGAERESGC
jgi:hypothetical protein